MHYGPVMIDIESTHLNNQERELLKHPNVGGVVLFSRNYLDKQTLRELITALRAAAEHPILIAVDHEGGRMWRFQTGFTSIKSARDHGVLYQHDAAAALKMAENGGFIMASELLACGIDLSFAPVLDLDYGLSEVIGDRAFHQDPNVVAALAEAFIEGMNRAGMAATGKHFPGHGGIRTDSHFKEAVDPRTQEVLMAQDLLPFARLNAKLGAVMPAHIVYPAVDSMPAGYSHIWLNTILRQAFGFKGGVISDCLSMKGAAMGGDFVIRSRMALDAGCDMVILTQQPRDTLFWVLENLNRTPSKETQDRLKALAGNFSVTEQKTAMA